MRKVRRIKYSIFMILIMCFCIFNCGKPAQAENVDCSTYTGNNEGQQNYSTYSSPMDSYLYQCSDGTLMKVQYIYASKVVSVEYYDSSYKIIKNKTIAEELPIFGGFYAMNGYYYLLTGQENSEESDTVEVYRVTKYDSNWNRISSCGLYGANTYIPFDAGSARMTHTGNYLIVRTCHEMYKSSDGYHHQANVTFEVDTSAMKITDSYTCVASSSSGYVSHSFNQFIKVNTDGKMVAIDHGDAYPRSIVLSKYNSVCTSGTFTKSCSTVNMVVPDGGTTGTNKTGLSVGGFEISSTHYLIAGNKMIDYSDGSSPRNIYVASVPKNGTTVSYKTITNLTSSDTTCTTPQLVKISDQKFLVLWTQGSKVFYVTVNESGDVAGTISSMEGNLSDCQPILVGSKIIWYTWNNEDTVFYEINTSTLRGTKKTVRVGHDYRYGFVNNGTIDKTCAKCGDVITETVPTSNPYTVWWKGYAGDYSPSIYNPGDKVNLEIRYSENADNKRSSVVSSNSSIIEVGTPTRNETYFPLTIKKAGITEISVTHKYDSSLRISYYVRVGNIGEIDIQDCDITLENNTYVYTGSQIKPKVTVRYQGIELEQDKDYSIEYSNNVEIGYDTGTITITGKGIFGNSVDKTFTINPISIASYTVEVDTDSYVYDGTKKQPNVTVRNEKNKIFSSDNYTVSYQNNISVGKAIARVTGKGNYGNHVDAKYTITELNLSDCEIELEYDSILYDGTEKKPGVTVSYKGVVIPTKDYKLVYENNTAVGMATVTVQANSSNCTGSKKVTFHIGEDSLKNATLTFEKNGYYYTGSPILPSDIKVTCKGKTLTLGTDYEVNYKDNMNAGMATVTVYGIGVYADEISDQFEIKKRNISDAEITLISNRYKYDGTEKKPSIRSIKDICGNSISASEYTLQYIDNVEVGTAYVKVAIKNTSVNYTGVATKEFEIYEEIPQSFRVWWKDSESTDNMYYSYYEKENVVGKSYYCWIIPDQGSAIDDMEVISSNEEIVSVSVYGCEYKITMETIGTATITIRPKKNQAIAKTYTFKVVDSSSTGGSTGGTTGGSTGGTTGGSTGGSEITQIIPDVTVRYTTHVQTYGWQGDEKNTSKWFANGKMAGTSGEAKRLEGIKIKVYGNDNLGIQYTTHCQSYGWLPWSANGEMNGTEGEAKRLEAIKIQLTGADKDKYDVYYRVHAQSYGWLGWAKNGQPAGTAGYAKRLEGIQIVIVKKGDAVPGLNYAGIHAAASVHQSAGYIAKTGSSPVVGNANTSNLNPVVAGESKVNVAYRTHVQTYGWQGWRYNGQMSGTSGEAKRLEGINIKLTNKPYSGSIVYTTHVQTYGWQGQEKNQNTWKQDGQMSGTSGEAKRLEAIRINLTGEMAEHYDIYYRVHAQTYGWLNWAKNGEAAGTAGYAKRLEGIQIVLVPKGEKAPARNYGGVVSTRTQAYIKK